jgi:hypothetical protein
MGRSFASTSPLTGWQRAGIVVLVIFCGFPALAMNGFGLRMHITPSIAFLCATLGGAVGGAMICSRPILAGLLGGLVAGTLGLLAVYYYTLNRGHVWNAEVAIVQCLASVPGVGLGWFMKKQLGKPAESDQSVPNRKVGPFF